MRERRRPAAGTPASRDGAHERKRQKFVFALPRKRTAGESEGGDADKRRDGAEHDTHMHLKPAGERAVGPDQPRQQKMRGHDRRQERPKRFAAPKLPRQRPRQAIWNASFTPRPSEGSGAPQNTLRAHAACRGRSRRCRRPRRRRPFALRRSPPRGCRCPARRNALEEYFEARLNLQKGEA